MTLFNLADDTEVTYRIVGKDEIDPTNGAISWVSPLAKAMLGKAIGDVIKAQTPNGEAEFEVIDIRYSPIENALIWTLPLFALSYSYVETFFTFYCLLVASANAFASFSSCEYASV